MVARDGQADLGRVVAVVDRPRGIDVILVEVAGDVVDRHPLLVLHVPELLCGGVPRVLQVLTAVADRPVLSHVVAVHDVDRAVWVKLGAVPEGVERQRHLEDPAAGVEVGVRVGHVGPARRHVLCAPGHAVIALDLLVVDRRPAQDPVRAEVEHVEGAELVEEELRRPDEVFRAGLDGNPRFRMVRVERARPARAGVRHRLSRRDWIATTGRRRARDLVRERHARGPGARGSGAGQDERA